MQEIMLKGHVRLATPVEPKDPHGVKHRSIAERLHGLLEVRDVLFGLLIDQADPLTTGAFLMGSGQDALPAHCFPLSRRDSKGPTAFIGLLGVPMHRAWEPTARDCSHAVILHC